MKLEFRCRDVFGGVYYQMIELPDDAAMLIGIGKCNRACLKGFAFSEDGCFLSESQLKNSRLER